MPSTLKRLASASLYYAGGTLLSGAVTLALLPVFTRYLTPSDFGVLALLTATEGVLSAAVGLNPLLFFTAKFPAFDRHDLRRYGGAAMLTTGVMVAAAFLVLEGLRHFFAPFQLPHWVLAGLALLGGGSAVLGLGLTTLKMRERPKPYATVEVLRSVAAGALGVLFVVGLTMDWRGKYLGQLIAGVVVAAVMLIYLFRTHQLGFDTSASHVREYVGFSLPVVPHSLGYWAINAQDRFFVFVMSGAEAAGLYTIGYMLAQVLEVVNQGVMKAFSPYFYGHLEAGTGKNEIVLLTYGYFGFVAVGTVAFVFVLEAAVPVFLGPDFTASIEFVPWVAAGYAFNAVRNFMTGYLYVAERTNVLGTIALVAAAVNALLNYLLIGWIGAVGAAVATTVTFLLIALATTFFATRFVEMPWRTALDGRSTPIDE